MKPAVRANVTAPAFAKPHARPVGISTPLPTTGFGGIAVDDVNKHVFIAGGQPINGGSTGSTGIIVTDFDGNILTDIETTSSVMGLFVDTAQNTLYASLADANAIAEIDLGTLAETKRWPCLDNDEPDSLVVIGDTAWFSSHSEISSMDLSTGESQEFNILSNRVGAVAGHPDWLVTGAEGGDGYQVYLQDISTGTPTQLASGTGAGGMTDFAVSSDGQSVYVGGAGKILHTSDLTVSSTFTPKDTISGSIATAGTSFAVGVGWYHKTASPNLVIYDAGGTTATAQYTLAQAPVVHGMAYSADGSRLFVVAADDAGMSLVVETDVGKVQTNVSLPLPHWLAATKGVTVHGAISFTNVPYDGKVRTLHVTRTDSDGTQDLPDITTSATGTFTLTDPATPLGKVSYAVTYGGDGTFGSVTQTAVVLREVPFDVNGDGHADLVVGAPGEDLGAEANTGSLDVLYGAATGVTGTGSKEYDQDTAGVPGVSESGDQFGWSQASGDFNGDGFPDLAVSANAEDGKYTNSGSIWIFYGSASGLRTTGITTISPTNLDPNNGLKYTNAFMGEVMAVGDFNGDGLADLASTLFGNIGEVAVAYGTPTGLSTKPTLYPVGATFGFGSSLSAGDINGDGCDDLAIGAPLDFADKGYYAGAVYIGYGSAKGLSKTGVQDFTKDTSGVPGSVKPFANDEPDLFGDQVDLADFNGDGKADLAVSAPGSPVTYGGSSHEDAGTVTILYSSGTKIATTNAVELSQATTGMPGNPGKNDNMGATMAVGDSNGDGKADLAIFSAGDAFVTVVKGATGGLSSTGVAWTQSSPGVPGSSETGDRWGDSLRFENIKGTAAQALAVGADGENDSAGAVTMLYSTSSGLTGTGSAAFSQNTSGVPGSSEDGDLFGSFYTW